MRLLYILVICFYSYRVFSAPLEGVMYVNGKESRTVTINAGEPVVLDFLFFAQNEDTQILEPVKDFQAMHEKVSHLVFLKRGLQHFSHVHPFYDEGLGAFQVAVNLPTQYPDNFDSINSLSEPGFYDINIEVKSRFHGMQTVHFELQVLGEKNDLPVLVDETKNGVITKYFSKNMQPEIKGAFYKIEFNYTTTPGQGGDLFNFYLKVFMINKEGHYIVGKDLQKWMMMGGHAIIAKLSDVKTPTEYLHLHAEMPFEGSTYYYSHFNRGKITADIYRAWFQIKHGSKVLTLPVTFRVTESINP